jgi:hypothetical protein
MLERNHNAYWGMTFKPDSGTEAMSYLCDLLVHMRVFCTPGAKMFFWMKLSLVPI